jgi:hypothetical protein
MNLMTDEVILQELPGYGEHCWRATPSNWEPGDPVGWGCTPTQAREHLLDQIQERIDYIMWANGNGTIQ